MKKASSSFIIALFAVLLVSFQSFAQVRYQDNVLHERVSQSVRRLERLSVSDLLRLSRQEQKNLEMVSLSLMAEHLGQGQTILELLQNGRMIATDVVKKNVKEVKFKIPRGILADKLELSALSDIYIESITAEVVRIGGQGPMEQQVASNSLITLQVNQRVYGSAQLPLKQLVKQQTGLSLEGAEIERVIVEGDPIYGRSASVQVELNNRLVGQVKYLSQASRQVPLPLQTSEVVRSLQLVVRGDAQIDLIRIRVGQVRQQMPQHQMPQVQRIMVSRQISQHLPLELSQLLPYETRMVRSITIDADAQRAQTRLSLMGLYGELQGSVIVNARKTPTIHLRRPMSLRELRLEAYAPAIIHSLEIEFEPSHIRY